MSNNKTQRTVKRCACFCQSNMHRCKYSLFLIERANGHIRPWVVGKLEVPVKNKKFGGGAKLRLVISLCFSILSVVPSI